METTLLISIASFVLAVIASILSIASFLRSGRFQRYEYATRLQVNEEELQFYSLSLDEKLAIRYKAKIENKGSKAVKIDRVYLEYGPKEDIESYKKHVIRGDFYLQPGESEEISHQVEKDSVVRAMEGEDKGECHFFFRVSYKDIDGNDIDKRRGLGGYYLTGDGEKSRLGHVFIANRGNTLT